MSLTLTPLQSDNFQRANQNPLVSPWEPDLHGDSPLQVVSDTCEGAGTNGNAMIFSYTGGLPNDQYASVTLAEAPTVNSGFGCIVRLTDNASNPYGQSTGYRFAAVMSGAGGGAANWGVYWEFGLLASGTATVAAGDVWTLAVVGTTIYVIQNGNVLDSFTDTKYSSGVAMLLAQPDFETSAVQISNFVIGSASTAAPPSGGGVPFLGSVRVVASAPSNVPSPFLGTVKVVSNAPSGVLNPYLGNVVSVGSAPNGAPNPSLGEVVIVANAPAGVNDPYLGELVES
jgi:hypothetical protein